MVLWRRGQPPCWLRYHTLRFPGEAQSFPGGRDPLGQALRQTRAPDKQSAMETSDIRRDSVGPWTALLLLGICLLANQYLTLPRLKRFVLSQTAGDSMDSIQKRALDLILDNWTEVITPIDVAIGVAILIVIAYLVYTELARGALTAILRRAETSRSILLLLLGFASLVITRYYLNPGQVFMGDTETHTLRSWMVAENLRNLQAPVWSNYWYGGYPLLEFYGPLYFVVTALMTLLFGDIHLATKLLLWLCHVGSIFAMFFFLREATGRSLPALLGALAYALSFHRVQIILYQGDLQLSVVFLLYPLILLLIERFLSGAARPRSTFLLFTCAVVALILNHHGYAFFGLAILGIYLLVRVVTWSGRTSDRLRVLAYFTLAGCGALLVSAFLLVPFILEASYARGMPVLPFSILVPNVRAPILFLKLFRWAAVGDGGSVGYIGLSIGVLAALAIPHAIINRVGPAIALAAGAAASLLMVRDNIQYNVKNLDFFMFYVAALTAWAPLALEAFAPKRPVVERLKAKWAEHFAARVTLILIGFLLVDLGPTTFHSVYREDYRFKEQMYQRLVAVGDSYKVIERQVLKYESGGDPLKYVDADKLGVISAYDRLQSPLGFFHEGAGRSFGYNVEMVKNLHRELNEGRLSDLSILGLYLMGVKYVLFRDRYRYFSPPLQASGHYALEEGILRLKHATPLILSTRVVSTSQVEGYPRANLIETRRYFDPETYDHSGRHFREIVLPLIKKMGVDMERGVADVLIAEDGWAASAPGRPVDLRVEITDFSVDLKAVTVRYRSNMDAFGRLAYTYFPYLAVEVDGEPVKFFRSAMNYILVPLPAGEHVLTTRGVASPLCKRTFLFSLVALLAVVLLPARVFAVFKH